MVSTSSIRGLCSVLLPLSLLLAVSRATAASTDEVRTEISRLRTVLDSHLKAVRTEAEQSRQALLTGYSNALSQFLQAAQQRGDLEAWKALNSELERLKKERKLPGTEIIESLRNDMLSQAVSQARTAVQKLQLASANRIIVLKNHYVSALEERLKQHVRAGEIEQAGLYQAEIEQAAKRPDVVAAEFDLVEHSPVATSPQPDAETSIQDPADQDEEAVPRVSHQGDGTVWLGEPDRSQVKLDYRPLPTYRTEQSSLAAGLLAKLKMAEIPHTTMERYDGFYSDSRYTSGNTDHALWVHLRPRNSEQVFDGLLVTAQYFAKRAAGSSNARSKPFELAIGSVKVDHLDNEGVTCCFAPVGLEMSKYRYSSAHSRYSSAYGEEFYGVVVSVFDSNRKLIYQGCSNANLKNMGRMVPPAPGESLKELDD